MDQGLPAAMRYLLEPSRPGARRPPAAGILWFPVVGAALGAVWVATAQVVNTVRGPVVAAAAVLIVDALLTRARHLHGLAAMSAGPDPVERSSAASTAVVLALLLRFALLILTVLRPVTLLVAPIAGRAGMGLLAASGAGHVAGLLAVACALTVLPALAGVVPFTLREIVGLGAGLAGGAVCGLWWRRRDGALGDEALFGVGIVAETLALAVMAVG